MVVVNGVPNVPACLTPVTAGLDVRTQHGLDQTTAEEGPKRGT
jgi:hypothetical protein